MKLSSCHGKRVIESAEVEKFSSDPTFSALYRQPGSFRPGHSSGGGARAKDLNTGVFLPKGNNGHILFGSSPVYPPTFEHNQAIADTDGQAFKRRH